LFDQNSPIEFTKTKQQASSDLENVHWCGFGRSSECLNHENLDGKCDDHHNYEQGIFEEPCEHVHFTFEYLSGIDDVEQLHENKDLENRCVVHQLLCLITHNKLIWGVNLFRGIFNFIPVGITHFLV
jgi:hypothetical protein